MLSQSNDIVLFIQDYNLQIHTPNIDLLRPDPQEELFHASRSLPAEFRILVIEDCRTDGGAAEEGKMQCKGTRLIQKSQDGTEMKASDRKHVGSGITSMGD
ncbi:MAG: hypothetical protein Q9187_000365 [Circinaria calcarea]